MRIAMASALKPDLEEREKGRRGVVGSCSPSVLNLGG